MVGIPVVLTVLMLDGDNRTAKKDGIQAIENRIGIEVRTRHGHHKVRAIPQKI